MRSGIVLKEKKNAYMQSDLSLINQYTRKELTADEVYIFSLVLCDNDIDRDFERFTVESLFALEKLFVGKTGIFDHEPKAHNQCARIFSCKVESVEGKKTKSGDDYFRLTAKAYIPKSEENMKIISSVDSGILKEISVGCSVEKTVCSVCGNELMGAGCNHRKGGTYSDKLCYGELINPLDAYEFSFVAVPAQTGAGVIKKYNKTEKEFDMNEILKSIKSGKGITLTDKNAKELSEYIKELEVMAHDGAVYKNGLKESVLKLSAVTEPEMSFDTMKSIVEKLSICELKELAFVYQKKADKVFTPNVQLSKSEKQIDRNDKNTQFRI